MDERELAELKARLREAAGRHQPDSERIAARVRAATSAGRGRRRTPRWVRAGVPAAAAVAAVCAAVVGVRAAYDDGGRVSAVTRPGRSTEPTPAGSTTSLHVTPPSPRTPSDTLAPSATYLRSNGKVDPHSNPHWSQSNVTLDLSKPITSLTVTIRITRTPGVATTGAWTTIPQNMMTTTVNPDGRDLVYRFVLHPGSNVAKGHYIFAAQYNHAKGREATTDHYSATTAGPSGRAAVHGDFS